MQDLSLRCNDISCILFYHGIVKLNIIPNLGSKPDINISMAESAGSVIRNQTLYFTGGDSGVDTNITMDGVKIHANDNPAVKIEEFNRINLILKNVDIYVNTNATGIKKDDASSKGSIHLQGAYIGSYSNVNTPIELGDVSTGFTIYSNNSENNKLEGDGRVIRLKTGADNKLVLYLPWRCIGLILWLYRLFIL